MMPRLLGNQASRHIIAWWAGATIPDDPTAPPEVDPAPPPVEIPPPPPITVPGPPTPPPIRAATRHRSAPGSKVTDAEEHSDPAMLPVEPDEGLVQPAIPDDPEHDRQVDPEA
jgi:hypothetical protein